MKRVEEEQPRAAMGHSTQQTHVSNFFPTLLGTSFPAPTNMAALALL